MKEKNKTKLYLEQILKDLFNTFLEQERLENKVKLKIINKVNNLVGSTCFNKNLDEAIITININFIIKSDDLKEKQVFNAVCALIHEMEHVKTFIRPQKYNDVSFGKLISLMELINCGYIYDIDPKKINLTGYKLYKIRKQINNNYDISTSETNANLIGYTKAFKLLKNTLNEEEKKSINGVIRILELINNNMEIYYDGLGNCVNKFTLFIEHTAYYIHKYPSILEDYPIMNSLFNNDGSLKTICQVYDNIDAQNIEMYKKIIIFYILSIDADYNEIFANDEAKKIIEQIFEEYIDNALEYFRKKEVCKLFIDDYKILNDNWLIKKKNIQVLNKLIMKYNLTIQTGTIVGNSGLGCQKRLFK